MAFIKEYKTIYICPVCGEELQWIIMTNNYKHSIYGMVMVNNYPGSCENNGKTLKEKDIRIINCPVIIKDKITMSF